MNIELNFVTEATFHEPSGWLNAVEANAAVMSVTEAVFHDPIGWLKAVQPENMLIKLTADLVSQLLKSWLKTVLRSNIPAKSVTLDTFQEPNG